MQHYSSPCWVLFYRTAVPGGVDCTSCLAPYHRRRAPQIGNWNRGQGLISTTTTPPPPLCLNDILPKTTYSQPSMCLPLVGACSLSMHWVGLLSPPPVPCGLMSTPLWVGWQAFGPKQEWIYHFGLFLQRNPTDSPSSAQGHFHGICFPPHSG